MSILKVPEDFDTDPDPHPLVRGTDPDPYQNLKGPKHLFSDVLSLKALEP
jgi:hypothetical protein